MNAKGLGSALLLVGALGARAEAGRFVLPAGWTDLSPGVPWDNFADVPEPIVEQARSGKFVAMAIPKEGGALFAILTPRDMGYLSDSHLEIALRVLRASARVIESGIVRIRARRTGRILFEQETPYGMERGLYYLVPSGEVTYGMLYRAQVDQFELHRAEFDAAAEANIVSLNPAWWGVSRGEGLVGGLVVGLAALQDVHSAVGD